jgi:hypothetical protein
MELVSIYITALVMSRKNFFNALHSFRQAPTFSGNPISVITAAVLMLHAVDAAVLQISGKPSFSNGFDVS